MIIWDGIKLFKYALVIGFVGATYLAVQHDTNKAAVAAPVTMPTRDHAETMWLHRECAVSVERCRAALELEAERD